MDTSKDNNFSDDSQEDGEILSESSDDLEEGEINENRDEIY